MSLTNILSSNQSSDVGIVEELTILSRHCIVYVAAAYQKSEVKRCLSHMVWECKYHIAWFLKNEGRSYMENRFRLSSDGLGPAKEGIVK